MFSPISRLAEAPQSNMALTSFIKMKKITYLFLAVSSFILLVTETLASSNLPWLSLLLLLLLLLLLPRGSTAYSFVSSSSSSSIVAPRKHGVFLSFRGTDTRNSFVSHLYEALRQQGIPAFIDSQDFQRGSEISLILEEIQKSNVSVVILSPNYAESPWCLEELVKIMECRKTQGQQVLPVFYRVDPSDVENQSGSYGAAFKKHQAGKKITAEALECWGNALIEVANLSGHVIDNSSEAEAIKDIVNDISNKLQPLYPNDFQDLVGMEQRIQQVESLLCIGEEDIRVVGIWGMGGIGKTTLAEALFNKYNSYFDGRCFLKHVRERSNSRGLDQLKEDLVLEIFNGKPCGSTDKMLKQLRHRKVLVVLDDVDNCRQYDEIIGNYNKFGPGSRIIITSRDKQVLRNVGSHEWIYEISALEEEESLQLFKLYALKDCRQQNWHLELSKGFVNYVKGNPLGLKILSQHLQGKDEQVWKSALCKIKEGLHKDLTEALKISFDGLDFRDKQIFLDMACFFNRHPASEVRRFLHSCYGSSVEDRLRNLADKSLVTMSSPDVDMHDLLEEMGKEVVREESRKEPRKRSRLWNYEDILQVLTDNTGSETVEGISMVNYQNSLRLAPTVFANMPRLRFLRFRPCHFECPSNILELPEGLQFLSNKLRHFEWHYYPSRSLPSCFVPEKIVTLDMSYSEVEQLWNGVWKFPYLHTIIMEGSKIKRLWSGVQDMPNLKIMNLSWCEDMIEMPDLSKAPKLEELCCSGCKSLEEVSPSISHLSSLKKLDFRWCEKIRSFPSSVGMMYLTELPLGGCSNLTMFPEVSRNIERLDLYGAGIGSLPDTIDWLSSLRELDVSSSSIESIPTNIIQLSQLQKLNIIDCKMLRRLPELPPSVCVLQADRCKSLQTVSISTRHTPVEVLKRPNFAFNDDCILDFSFADCINLEESARKKIFACAQQSITSVVTPTAYKFINKLVEKTKRCENWIISRFGVPGNEMPDWIEHQSGGGAGSSITIDFWPLNLLGFIFCAVFDFQPFGEGYDLLNDAVKILFKVQLKSNHCGSRRESRSTYWMLCPELESQHVLLCYAAYVPNKADSQYSELSATMEVTAMKDGRAGAVVKWGLSLIHKGGTTRST